MGNWKTVSEQTANIALPPNVLGTTTCAVTYKIWAAATVGVFGGNIKLPPSLGTMVYLDVYAVDPAGNMWQIAHFDKNETTDFVDGGTIPYSGYDPHMVQSATDQTGWSCIFIPYNADYVPNPAPFEIGSLTIAHASISSLSVTDNTAARWSDPALHAVEDISISVTSDCIVGIWSVSPQYGRIYHGLFYINQGANSIRIGAKNDRTTIFPPTKTTSENVVFYAAISLNGSGSNWSGVTDPSTLPTEANYTVSIAGPGAYAATGSSNTSTPSVTYPTGSAGAKNYVVEFDIYLPLNDPDFFFARVSRVVGKTTGGAFTPATGGINAPTQVPIGVSFGDWASPNLFVQTQDHDPQWSLADGTVNPTGLTRVHVVYGPLPVAPDWDTIRFYLWLGTRQDDGSGGTKTQQSTWPGGADHYDITIDPTGAKVDPQQIPLADNLGVDPNNNLTALNAQGQNILSNPGFEQGLVGWNAYGLGSAVPTASSAQSHNTGGKSLSFTTAPTLGQGIAGNQTFTDVAPGDVLAGKFWILGDPGNHIQAILIATWYDRTGGFIRQDNFVGLNDAPTAWTQCAGLTPPAPAGTAKVVISPALQPYVSGGTGNAWLDDIWVAKLSTANPSLAPTSDGSYTVNNDLSGNLLLNSGFERGDLTAWLPFRALSDLSVVASPTPYAGTYCCKVALVNDWTGPYQLVPCKPGQLFILEALLSADSTAAGHYSGAIGYAFYAADKTTLVGGPDLSAAQSISLTTSWQKAIGTVTAPAGSSYIAVRAVLWGAIAGPGGFMFVDAVSCKLVPGTGGALTVDASGNIVLPAGGVTNSYLAGAAVGATNMQASSVTYANSALAALAVVDSNMYSVSMNKVTYGTSVFAGPVILSRGNGFPVISLDSAGIFLFGQGTASGSAGAPGSSSPSYSASGLTSLGYVGITSTQIAVYAPVSGGLQPSVIIQGSNITLWSNNGNTVYPYLTLSSSNLTLYSSGGSYFTQINSNGLYVYSGSFSLTAYSTGISLACVSGASMTMTSSSIVIVPFPGGSNTYITLGSSYVEIATAFAGGGPFSRIFPGSMLIQDASTYYTQINYGSITLNTQILNSCIATLSAFNVLGSFSTPGTAAGYWTILLNGTQYKIYIYP